jgi:hypothetical protein
MRGTFSNSVSLRSGSSRHDAGAALVFEAMAPPPPPLPAVWDWSGFYIGVGGSFNWTQFDQSLQGVSGIINFADSTYRTASLVAGAILVSPPPTSISLTGFVQGLAEINLKHQLALMGTIGRAFGNVELYAGGGPALFDVNTNFINGVPFAESPNLPPFPTSVPLTIFNDNWVWGGRCRLAPFKPSLRVGSWM